MIIPCFSQPCFEGSSLFLYPVFLFNKIFMTLSMTAVTIFSCFRYSGHYMIHFNFFATALFFSYVLRSFMSLRFVWSNSLSFSNLVLFHLCFQLLVKTLILMNSLRKKPSQAKVDKEADRAYEADLWRGRIFHFLSSLTFWVAITIFVFSIAPFELFINRVRKLTILTLRPALMFLLEEIK